MAFLPDEDWIFGCELLMLFLFAFVWRESLKSSNSLRIGPRPKMISYGFPLSKTEKSYGSSNAFQSKASPA